MKTATKEFKVCSYTELSQEAKETVKQWLLDDDWRCQEFKSDIEECLVVFIKKYMHLKCKEAPHK